MQSMFVTALLALGLGVAGGAVAADSRATAGARYLSASPYVKVRVAAARVLAARDDVDSLARLRRLAADPQVTVRLAAVHGLARRGARADVSRSLSDPTPALRALARRLLEVP